MEKFEPKKEISTEVLHGETVRLKDQINLNNVKDLNSFVAVFKDVYEKAKSRAEALNNL